METKTEYKVVTIDTLKQQAREREAVRAADKERAARAHAAALEHLRAKLIAESPLGQYPFEFTTWTHNRTGVRFSIPGHADIVAVWDYNPFDEIWYQRRLSSDGYGKDSYRVWEWSGTEYDPEDKLYRAAYRKVDFEDLDEALLHAERAYRDPADIQREVDDLNARQMSGSLAAHLEIPPPEPTAAEILLDALKSYIDERIAARDSD